ncbi:ABC transporter permease [Cellvibrio japonicus]|uniref:Transport permease protein n=1 Tax=Cellvibrio japonicus (strain Ueda107) TaxID=498211 RepID=B3PE45_CELJU|nr:ABC transporter permease [Cellvibrio japonicus]ACE82906.1 ABC-type multidrug transport system, permease component [Cellvibrio japonicus Ueda107]QEI12092.1 ABC transporter permease [Cellvibrio japonicus]QEI15666.1 ABC transporter permease [Cellvibrio japonicus]QEI19244.1 ABC transporter permease [Cellvibrio japonicus]
MSPHEQWVAFVTIVRKEIKRFTRIWIQTLLPPAITMVLYFIIFGKMVGSRIGEMGGVSYIDFVAPGLIMMAVLTNAYANVSSSFFSAKFQRSVEEILVSPTPNVIILLGYVIGGVARGLAVGVIVTLVAMAFTDLKITHGFVTFFILLMTAILFSLAGFINAVYANSFDDISIIPTFVLTPLTYLGGVFYSISLLPPVWQTLSAFNPILHMVDAFRYGMLGIADTGLVFAFVELGVLVVVLTLVALYLLKSGKRLRA